MQKPVQDRLNEKGFIKGKLKKLVYRLAMKRQFKQVQEAKQAGHKGQDNYYTWLVDKYTIKQH